VFSSKTMLCSSGQRRNGFFCDFVNGCALLLTNAVAPSAANVALGLRAADGVNSRRFDDEKTFLPPRGIDGCA
jgi:hypothetical protein